MEINCGENLTKDGWHVEVIRDDGEIEQALFYGPRAELRAQAYAAGLRLVLVLSQLPPLG